MRRYSRTYAAKAGTAIAGLLTVLQPLFAQEVAAPAPVPAVDPFVACVQDVTVHPQFSEIAAQLPLYDATKITFAMLANKSKMTPADKQALMEWFEKRDRCWADTAEYHRTHFPPEIIVITDEGNANFHSVGIDLYEGKITYGDANQRIQDIINTMRDKIVPVVRQYQTELAAQQKADAERRQQVAAQQRAEYSAQMQAEAVQEQTQRAQRTQLIMNYMNSMQAQQRLIQQPTYHTNCFTNGNNTNCTTR